MHAQQRASPAHRVGGGRARKADRCGRLIDANATPGRAQVQDWLAVYAGRLCIGHVVRRGKLGIEAFDVDDRSLGIFSSLKIAADAVTAARGRR